MNWVGEVDRELTFVTSTHNGIGHIYYGTSTQESNELSGILEWNSESMIFGGITAPKPA